MRLITSAVAALVFALTVVRADNPKPTIGHTATLIDKTVFIQGGSSTLNTAQNSAFSLILGTNGTLKDSTLLDHTTLSQFRARDFHGSVYTNGLMINCGSMDGAPSSGAFTCDIFNVMKYNSTPMAGVPTSAVSRGGVASTIADGVAYFLGGSGANEQYSNKTNVLVLGTMEQLKWRVDADMPNPTRYHTANFVSGVGVVVLGGQIPGGSVIGMTSATILNAGNWTQRYCFFAHVYLATEETPAFFQDFSYYVIHTYHMYLDLVCRAIGGDACPPRFGHTSVLSDNGILYVYGGKSSATGAPLNDIYSLNTKDANWVWKKLNAPTAEPRAFHASVLLADGNLLHIFGRFSLTHSHSLALYLTSVALSEPRKSRFIDVESISADKANERETPRMRFGSKEAEKKNALHKIIIRFLGGTKLVRLDKKL